MTPRDTTDPASKSHGPLVATPRPIEFPEGILDAASFERIETVLREGQVVALPTETVYGLAARADDPRAVERLCRLKGRDEQRALTWHVGVPPAWGACAALAPLLDRLAKRYWPGPLTLVFKGVPAGLEATAQEGWTGVRQPAHRATLDLCARLDFPLVATSANQSGAAPATDAAAVAELFPRGLGLILDGGPSHLGEPSCVLRVGPGTFELLRPGLLSSKDLRRTAGRRIGFVCTGNTCRSPMAEGIARQVLEQRLGLSEPSQTQPTNQKSLSDFGFEVSSMGVIAGPGAPASAHSVEVLLESGIDISEHRSSPAIPEEVSSLDEVYGLTQSHVDALRANLPPGKGKHVQLLDPKGVDIPDPIGAPRSAYVLTRDAIRIAIERRAESWA